MQSETVKIAMTPEMKRKLIIRKADEAVGKANFVLRDMKRKLEALRQEPITEPANKNIEDLEFRIRTIESDREQILAWKKSELGKLHNALDKK